VTTARRLFTLALLAFAFAGGPASSSALGPLGAPPDQIVMSGSVNVSRGQEVGEVVVLRGDVRVDGVAHGDVVVVSGDVVIRGQVSGSVIAVDGSVVLGPNAQVRGDVIARGEVTVSRGAVVGGQMRQHAAFTWRTPAAVFGSFASWLAVTVSTLALGFLLVLLAPRGADATLTSVRTAPWTCLGWGIGLAIAIPVLSVLALASLVGLPLGLAVLLALALLGFVGYTLSAYTVGRLIWQPPRSRALAFLFGWAIVRAVGAVPYVSGVTWGIGAVVGLGGMTVATWRARSVGGKHREGRLTQPSPPFGEEAGL